MKWGMIGTSGSSSSNTARALAAVIDMGGLTGGTSCEASHAHGVARPPLRPTNGTMVDFQEAIVQPGEPFPRVDMNKMKAQYRKKIACALKGISTKNGLFEKALGHYKEFVEKTSQDRSLKDKTPEPISLGKDLHTRLDHEKTLLNAWSVRTCAEHAARIDDLVERLWSCKDRLAEDCAVWMKRTKASAAGTKKKQLPLRTQQQDEPQNGDAAPLEGDAEPGSMWHKLYELRTLYQLEPSQFPEEGVLSDPPTMTSASAKQCVKFGNNGCLINDHTCHHILVLRTLGKWGAVLTRADAWGWASCGGAFSR
jgi:hypothetical protein